MNYVKSILDILLYHVLYLGRTVAKLVDGPVIFGFSGASVSVSVSSSPPLAAPVGFSP